MECEHFSLGEYSSHFFNVRLCANHFVFVFVSYAVVKPIIFTYPCMPLKQSMNLYLCIAKSQQEASQNT